MTDWDIISGVGITALGAAATRAIESCRPDALVSDPYAAAFVRAAGAPFTMPVTPEEAGSEQEFPWLSVTTYAAVRAKFFDTFAAAAAAAGVRQVVTLAAGLDTRAFRLEWPPGTTVYEVDAARVLEFKDSVLAGQGAGHPRCERRTVAADLREDWPAALRAAGFDPSRSTAWVAEGLLFYLPDDAKVGMLTTIHDLSAPGSEVGLEHTADVPGMMRDLTIPAMEQRLDFDLAGLWPSGQQHDPADWLTGHGWVVSVNPFAVVADSYGRPLDSIIPALRDGVLITARQSSAGRAIA
jgi:methyltransferase (TIGR00027 family)